MNAALHIVLASQAAAAAARKSLLERFRISDATHPARARSLRDLGIVRTSALDELVSKGMVREAGQGTFYLDEHTVAECGRTDPAKTKRAARVVVIVSLLLLLPILWLVASGLTN
jgi:hypothetical protein